MTAETWSFTFEREYDAVMQYYREPNGDYLIIDPYAFVVDPRPPYRGQLIYDGRAPAIANHVGSICTTRIGSVFLGTCHQVTKAEVPEAWLKILRGPE